MMEKWNNGVLGLYCIALKNVMIHGEKVKACSRHDQELISKTLIQILKLGVFDHHSIIPVFQYSM